MKPFTTMARWLRRRAENLIALLLGTMFVTFLVQILFRYVLNLPLGWTVEYVFVAWLWGILFGYAFVVRGPEIIRLDLVYNLVSTPIRRAMDIIANLACAGIFAWSMPAVFEFVTFMAIEKTAYIQILFDLVFAIYLPFAVAVIARSLAVVWHAIRGTEPHLALPEALPDAGHD